MPTLSQKQAADLSSLVLRLGLACVFILFGYDKLSQPNNWLVFYTPQLGKILSRSPYEFLRVQGIIEILIGSTLLAGFMTRISASAAACTLGLIVFFIWPDSIAVRDLGLLGAAVALVLSGGGLWSLDGLLAKKEQL